MAEFALADIDRMTILRVEVGSTLHGMALDGHDDRDELGIMVAPPEYVVGLRHFEQRVQRSQPEGVRSRPGDLDRVTYSLRKYCRLALGGNPTILLALYAPSEFVRIETALGKALRELTRAFQSKHAGRAFLGYMVQQRQRLVGELGQKRVKRPELVEAHGYDTKAAGHTLRLGYQGIEYLNTGRLTLPLPSDQRAMAVAVRRGNVPESDVLSLAGQLEQQLRDALDATWLPDEPDRAAVDQFLLRAHFDTWQVAGLSLASMRVHEEKADLGRRGASSRRMRSP